VQVKTASKRRIGGSMLWGTAGFVGYGRKCEEFGMPVVACGVSLTVLKLTPSNTYEGGRQATCVHTNLANALLRAC
jgi:hypothetical protein